MEEMEEGLENNGDGGHRSSERNELIKKKNIWMKFDRTLERERRRRIPVWSVCKGEEEQLR